MLDIYHRYATIDKTMSRNRHSHLKVLEVGSAGAGYGRYFKPGKYELTSVDIQIIPEAEKQLYPHIKFISYKGDRLPFKDKRFDVVICVDTLEHVPYKDRPVFLKELMRVCKDRVLIIFPHDKSAKTEARFRQMVSTISRGRLKMQPLMEHLDCVLPQKQEVKKFFDSNDFKVESTDERLNLAWWIPLKGFSSLIYPILRKRSDNFHRPMMHLYKRSLFPLLNFGTGYSVFIAAKRSD